MPHRPFIPSIYFLGILTAQRCAIGLVALSLVLPVSAAADSGDESIRFEAISEAGLDYQNLFGGPEKLYLVESTGNGAAWLDYDNDGWLDLFVVNGSTFELQEKGEGGPGNRLYHNRKNGTFEDVTSGSGLEGGYWGSGVAVGDYDNDGFVDLYVTTVLEGNHLYHNDGDGSFTDVTAEAGVEGGLRDSASAAFFDYDRDGHLDLFVTNYTRFDRAYIDRFSPYCLWKDLRVFCGPIGVPGDSNVLYHNNGDGSFSDVTRDAGVFNPKLRSLGVVTADLDDDGWPDIYVASDATINALYRNRGNGTFEDVSLVSGTGYSHDGRSQSGMGVDAGDYNGDGRLDLFVLNFQEDYNTLYRNEGDLSFADVTLSAKLGRVSFRQLGWGTGFRDFDNDGRLDLFVANGHVYPQVDSSHLPDTYAQQNQLFRNIGSGQFSEVTDRAGESLEMVQASRGVAFGDFDNDGRMDVLVVNMDDTLTLLHNTTRNDNHWLMIKVIGSKSNRDGIGARLRLTAGGQTQVREVKTAGSFVSSNDPRVHFGLGPADNIERLEILWPSGETQSFQGVPVDRFLVIHEKEGMKQPQ